MLTCAFVAYLLFCDCIMMEIGIVRSISLFYISRVAPWRSWQIASDISAASSSEPTAMALEAAAIKDTIAALEAAPKAKARGGRPKAASRPKIDIDLEIIEANRLAQVTKRMMQAAKAAQRNSQRSKQRLVRKAGKLSAADLERIAVLKRCGLFVADEESDTTAPGSSEASGSASSASSPASLPSVSPANLKLASVVGKISGVAEMLTSMQDSIQSVAESSGLPEVGGGQRASAAPIKRPRGRFLMRAASTDALGELQAHSAPKHQHPEQVPQAEHESTEDADADM